MNEETWLKIGAAYERYHDKAENPIAFHSFCRLVTQGKIPSRVEGGRREVQPEAVDTFADSKEPVVPTLHVVPKTSLAERSRKAIKADLAADAALEVAEAQLEAAKMQKADTEKEVAQIEEIIGALEHSYTETLSAKEVKEG
jgi:hypothetical protein